MNKENTKNEEEILSFEEFRTINSNNNKEKNKIKEKKKKNIIRKNKEKIIIEAINNKKNPYSVAWTNNYLKANYNSGLEIKGFNNGVPQFKINKLKEENNLPPIINISQNKFSQLYKNLCTFTNNNKEEKNEKNVKEGKNNHHKIKDKIQFQFILNYFSDGNEKNNSKYSKEEKKNDEIKFIFNNYDGNYDVRNEKDYEKIKKQFEENSNIKPKKIENKLEEINENEEDS